MTWYRDHRSSPFRWTVVAAALLFGLTIVAEASAGDRHRERRRARVDDARAELRDARAYDRALDREGARIDRRYDFFAAIASAHGAWFLADHLDRKGDRIERRLDRRGDRALRDARADLRDARRRPGHHRHAHAGCNDRRHGHAHKKHMKRHARRHHGDRHFAERDRDRDRRDRRDRDLRDRKRDRKHDRDRDRDRRRDRRDRDERTTHTLVDGGRLIRMLP